ncbi:MAG: hypothetical protein IJZ12_01055 [Clostridia bacterium]|nr:hypothetical protein [Clostridia bacterium]
MPIGVEKRLDELGRVVIPKELRDFYHLNEKVTLVETEKGILITNPQYVMVKVEEK